MVEQHDEPEESKGKEHVAEEQAIPPAEVSNREAVVAEEEEKEEEKEEEEEEEEGEELKRAEKFRARNDVATRGSGTKIIMFEADIERETLREKCGGFYPKLYNWCLVHQEQHYPTCEYCIDEWMDDEEKCKKPLQTCKACRVVHYCCREHQRIDWKNRHKRMCQDLVALKDDPCTPFIMRKLDAFTPNQFQHEKEVWLYRAPRRFLVATRLKTSLVDETFLRSIDLGCAFRQDEEEEGKWQELREKDPDAFEANVEVKLERLRATLGCLCRENCGWPTIISVCNVETGLAAHFVPALQKGCRHDPTLVLEEAGKEGRQLTDEDLAGEMQDIVKRLKELSAIEGRIKDEKNGLYVRFDHLGKLRKNLGRKNPLSNPAT